MNLPLITKYFTPNVILDIGGHTGEFYGLAKSVFPNAYVFIIEGNKDCEPYLKRLGVRYLIRLLGKENTKTIFYKTKSDPICTGNSLYREITPHFKGEQALEEEIELRTLDTTFKEETCFDLIKIDTQGAELDILRGGAKIAKKAKGILLEVSYVKYNEGAPLYDEVVKFMDEYGFVEKEILSEVYWSNDGYGEMMTCSQKDVLFINKNIL
jgi:FkbM family methyltransferase